VGEDQRRLEQHRVHQHLVQADLGLGRGLVAQVEPGVNRGEPPVAGRRAATEALKQRKR